MALMEYKPGKSQKKQEDRDENTEAKNSQRKKKGKPLLDEGLPPEMEVPADEEAAPPTDKHGNIKGVFSTQTIMKIGTGTTQRKTIQKSYWYAIEQENDQIEIQPLNKNYVPSGPKRFITKDDLLAKFAPEPEFYTYNVYPAMRQLTKTIARGDRHRKRGESFSAEMEYSTALNVDEENVRANFGLGLTYLQRGEKNKAQDIFHRVVKLDAAFEGEHKHLFNEFGINLRKNKMYDQALEYYNRALKLAKVDENLHYNIARANFEVGNVQKAVEHLKTSLKLNPGFEEGKQFLIYLKKRGVELGEGQDLDKVLGEDAVKSEQAEDPEKEQSPEDDDPDKYQLDI